MSKRNLIWAVAVTATFLLASNVTAGLGLIFPGSKALAQSQGSQWPTLEQQLSDAKVQRGTALETLIRANQDFAMLRPSEAKDGLRLPPWLRVFWRKAHPEGVYSGDDPTGGYPLVLKEIYEWMTTHQDLRPGTPEPLVMPGESAASVGTNVRASGLQGTARSESDVRINFGNPQQIIIASNNISASGAQAQFFSHDGGATWGQTTLPLSGGDSFHSDPTVDWTSDGRAWSTTLGIVGGSLRGRSYVSTDAGVTWAPDSSFTFSGSQTSVDKQMFWVDHSALSPFKDNIYVIWHNGLPAFVNRRTAAGWQTPIQVSGAESTGTAIGSDIKTNSAGDVFGFWPTTGNRRIFVVKSTTGGVSYGAPVQIATTFDGFDIGVPSFNNRRALIYVSGGAYKTATKDLVYASWCDLTGEPGCTSAGNEPGANVGSTCKTRIWFSRSTNGGTTWSAPVMINNQPGLSDQYNQWLAVDETTGLVAIIYYDTVDDPGREKTDIWYQSSFNDGVSWNAPVKVTTAQTDETIPGSESGNQYGDYNGLSAYAGVLFPSWTDRRNNAREEIWTAPIADVPCTTPGVPVIGMATPIAPNQIEVTWSSGSPAPATYNLYRAMGSCGSGTFTLLASGLAGPPYVDSTVSGGTTYSYQVTGVESTGFCESVQSGCASATATGACTLAPTFAGLTSVTNAELAGCQLNLAWAAASANCGGPVTYNVYRSTVSGFVPSGANLVATGIGGTTYSDTSPLMNGTTHYYIVRAVDGANLAQDQNTVQRSGVPTGPITISTITETFEGAMSGGGFDNAGWTHNAIIGGVDWVWSTAQNNTPTHSWFSASQTTVSDRVLVSPSFGVIASTTLSFWHTFNFEGNGPNFYDGGTLEISTNGGSSWAVIPDAAFTAGLFNCTINANFSNPIGGLRGWGQGSIGPMTQVSVNLGAFAGSTARIRWHAGDDISFSGTGWFVDSVTITNAGTAAACTPNPPTSIDLVSFTASAYDGGTLLEWSTGREADNLGFNIYREQGGRRVLATPRLIAGSALAAGFGTVLSAGRSYSWWDKEANGASRYWIEDLDLSGKATWHGPFSVRLVGGAARPASNATVLEMLSQLASNSSAVVDRPASVSIASAERLKSQSALAGGPAVKLSIRNEGWYRVSQAELVAAGFDAQTDHRLVQIHVDGQQIPISVKTDAQKQIASVDFYARGIEASYTNTRVYWLITGSKPGLRLIQVRGEGSPSNARNFLHTVERKERTIYFAALRNGEKENFFGAVVAREPVNQTLNLNNVDPTVAAEAQLEVSLQGVTHLPHAVSVLLNGAPAAEIRFNGQALSIAHLKVPHSLLREGDNQVQLVAHGGLSDVSLVDYVRISYFHTFAADQDQLRFSAPGKQAVTIGGFSNASIQVLDVTDPDAVKEISGSIEQRDGGYEITVASPDAGDRILFARAAEPNQPASVAENVPSNLRSAAHAASLLMIASREMLSSLGPLKTARIKQGFKVEAVDIEDVFDEFSFGHRSPLAIRDFLKYARTIWETPPQYVLLVGDASLDPKNHLGFGDLDLVPTRLIDTALMETASDDWFADLNADGLPELAIGRLPARTAADAAAIVGKIVNYELSPTVPSLTLVADSNDGFDFERASEELRAFVPSTIKVGQINRGKLDPAVAKGQLLEAIKRGDKIINYTGHGSANQWRGNLLTNEDASGLTNSNRLPVFLMMTCLNGYFHDAGADSLAEALMKAKGGAVAVWTSSAMTGPAEQTVMNRQAFRLLLATSNKGGSVTVGEAMRKAKAAITDSDIRRSWILFGDPSMKLR